MTETTQPTVRELPAQYRPADVEQRLYPGWVAAEPARATRDRAAAAEIARRRGKLGNATFTAKARVHVVAKITERLTTAEADPARISPRPEAIPA